MQEGYTDSVAFDLTAAMGIAADVQVNGSTMGSIWLGTDNPAVDNPELRALALDLRANLSYLDENCKQLYSVLTKKGNPNSIDELSSHISNDLAKLQSYEDDLLHGHQQVGALPEPLNPAADCFCQAHQIPC